MELETASPDGFGEVAYNVEQCQCPPNYVGTSCEVSKINPFVCFFIADSLALA